MDVIREKDDDLTESRPFLTDRTLLQTHHTRAGLATIPSINNAGIFHISKSVTASRSGESEFISSCEGMASGSLVHMDMGTWWLTFFSSSIGMS